MHVTWNDICTTCGSLLKALLYDYRAVGAGPAGAAAAGPKFSAPTQKMAAADSLSTNLAKRPLLP